MMIPSVLILCFAFLQVSGELHGRSLVRKLFLRFPPHELLNDPLNERINHYLIEEFTGFFNKDPISEENPPLCQPTYKGSINLGAISPSYEEPLWCLNEDHYVSYIECHQGLHNTSLYYENRFLFRASGWFDDLSLNYTRPLSAPEYSMEPIAIRLQLSAHIEIDFFLQFTKGICHTSAGKAQVYILPKRTVIFEYKSYSTAMNIDPEIPDENEFQRFSPYNRIVERLCSNLVQNLEEILPLAYSTSDVSNFICNAI